MKYSEAKERVLEAKAVGLVKVPKQKMWVKYFSFPGGYRANYYVSNSAVIHTYYPLDEWMNTVYLKYYAQYAELRIKEGR